MLNFETVTDLGLESLCLGWLHSGYFAASASTLGHLSALLEVGYTFSVLSFDCLPLHLIPVFTLILTVGLD